MLAVYKYLGSFPTISKLLVVSEAVHVVGFVA